MLAGALPFLPVGAGLLLLVPVFWLLWSLGNLLRRMKGGLSEAAAELGRAQGSLEERRKLDELKSEFLSTVSHELRTPLTSIQGYTQLLLEGDTGALTDIQREFLGIIESNSARLAALVDDVLDLGRLETGKLSLHRESVRLSEVLGQAVRDFEAVARKKGLALTLSIPPEGAGDAVLLGDRARLLQIFSNLLSNAIKYTERGSVKVSLDAKRLMASVEIRDTGGGMNAEEQSRLFERFYRTPGARASAVSGTGLGLVIVKGLVEAHGGRISVRSVPGEGSVFTVALPTSEWPVGSARSTESISEVMPAPSGPVLWLVEPEPARLERLSRLAAAERLGRLIPFARVEDLPEVAQEWPSLVILGTERTGDISFVRSRIPGGVPILYLGASTDPATAFGNGASGYLSKDCGDSEVSASIRDLVKLKGRRILLADADTDLRLLIKRSLEQVGFEVDDVDRGAAVLRRLEQERYDLALLGLNFKDLTGKELMKLIRRQPGARGLTVFAMLDDQGRSPPSRESLLALAADQFVGKHQGIGGIVDAVCEQLKVRPLRSGGGGDDGAG